MQLKRLILLSFFQMVLLMLSAQTDSNITPVKPQQPVIDLTDSLIKKSVLKTDSNKKKTDSLTVTILADSLHKDSLQKIIVEKQNPFDTATYASLFIHPYLPFGKPPVYQILQARQPEQQNELFYVLTGLVFFIALIKIIAPKYINTIFSIFFQTSFRQEHTRKQLMQYKIASLGMNIFFFMAGSLYSALLAKELHLTKLNFWWLLLCCFILLIVMYCVKYLFLFFSGWVFNVKKAANVYTFYVFLVNKIIGMVLLPIVLVIAFSTGESYTKVIIKASLIIVGLLLLYRYTASTGNVLKHLKASTFHIFLYLCTVEIMPLLLIYKLLFNYIGAN